MSDKKRDPYFRILGYVKPHYKLILASFLCIILYSIFSALVLMLPIPLLETFTQSAVQQHVEKQNLTTPGSEPSAAFSAEETKNSIINFVKDLVVVSDPSESLLRLCFFIGVVFLGRAVTGYFQQFFMNYVEQNLIRDVRNDLYKHINSLSMQFFVNQKTGNLMSRFTNDTNSINIGIRDGFMTMMRDPLLILTYLTMCFIISWKLTLFTLFILPIAGIVIYFLGQIIHRQSKKSQETMAGITSVLQETILGAKVVKAFGMENFENSKFMNETAKFFKIRLKISKIDAVSAPLNELLGSLTAIFIIYYGGYLVLDGHMESGAFITFVLLILQISPPLKSLGQVNNKIQESRAAATRIFEILDTVSTVQEPNKPEPNIPFEKSIIFHNVSFHYNLSSELILNDISFTAEKGEIIALVGPSGAGKSTLIDLIPRFYDPTKGRITIDGQDLKHLSLSNIRSLMGIVTQETILFNDTIRNNIAYGMADISDEKVIEAAKAANAHHFITDMPEGYNTIVGDRGMKISGGQRQRIAIARALLKNPPIMILDEATSALDTESEKSVQEAIETLMKNRTSFVVAHRLSTVRNADKIIVLQKGKIVQIGRHDELLKDESGLYRKLHDMQFREE